MFRLSSSSTFSPLLEVVIFKHNETSSQPQMIQFHVHVDKNSGFEFSVIMTFLNLIKSIVRGRIHVYLAEKWKQCDNIHPPRAVTLPFSRN